MVTRLSIIKNASPKRKGIYILQKLRKAFRGMLIFLRSINKYGSNLQEKIIKEILKLKKDNLLMKIVENRFMKMELLVE